MKRLLKIIASIRHFSEISSLLLFIIFWPAANLYLVACGMLGVIGKAIFGISSTFAEIIGAISVFMMFLVPFWAMAVMGSYFLATALAFVSLRPIPLILLSAAWLEMKRYSPTGHIQLVDIPKIYDGSLNWLYPFLYSALPILGGILVVRKRVHQFNATNH